MTLEGITNVICMWTREPVTLPALDRASDMSNYLETWKQCAAKNGLRSIMVVAIDENGVVQWDIKTDDSQHLMQIYIELDSLKSVISGLLYPDAEDDED